MHRVVVRPPRNLLEKCLLKKLALNRGHLVIRVDDDHVRGRRPRFGERGAAKGQKREKLSASSCNARTHRTAQKYPVVFARKTPQFRSRPERGTLSLRLDVSPAVPDMKWPSSFRRKYE